MKRRKTKPETYQDIILSKVNEETLTEKLLDLGLEVPDDADVKAKLDIFTEWTDKRIAVAKKNGEDYAQCDNCDARCDPTWSACPVCGVGDTDKGAEPEPPPESEPAPPVEIVKADEPKEDEAGEPRPMMTVQDLDASLERVKTYLDSSLSNYWKLGREIYDLFNNRLYKCRTDGGKQKYKSWNEFSEAEIGLSGARTRVLMRMSQVYTEGQFLECGVEKLTIIMRADRERQAELLNMAPGMSARALASHIIPGIKPPVVEGQLVNKLKINEERIGTEAAKAARQRKALAKSGQAVSVVFQTGTHDIPLKPHEKGKGFECQEELVNGVIAKYQILMDGKKAFLRITYKRPNDEQEEAAQAEEEESDD